jgi:hypothetical protein
MSFWAKAQALLTDTFFGGVRDIVDELHTSDEEKMQLRNQLAAMANATALQLETLAQDYEKEVTARHAADMSSDSWLSKNIRPITLGFLIGMTVLLVWATTFAALKPAQIQTLQGWIPLLQVLDVTAVTFYFGSRGLEKYKEIKSKNEYGARKVEALAKAAPVLGHKR